MLQSEMESLRVLFWYTIFGSKPAGTSNIFARSCLKSATLALLSTSTTCLRSFESITLTFIGFDTYPKIGDAMQFAK